MQRRAKLGRAEDLAEGGSGSPPKLVAQRRLTLAEETVARLSGGEVPSERLERAQPLLLSSHRNHDEPRRRLGRLATGPSVAGVSR
jgi:hypothetical protein